MNIFGAFSVNFDSFSLFFLLFYPVLCIVSFVLKQFSWFLIWWSGYKDFLVFCLYIVRCVHEQYLYGKHLIRPQLIMLRRMNNEDIGDEFYKTGKMMKKTIQIVITSWRLFCGLINQKMSIWRQYVDKTCMKTKSSQIRKLFRLFFINHSLQLIDFAFKLKLQNNLDSRDQVDLRKILDVLIKCCFVNYFFIFDRLQFKFQIMRLIC